MFGLQETHSIRATIRSLFAQCDIPYEVTPFNHGFYQECVDEAARRGYALGGDHTMQTFLRMGAHYAVTAGAHLTHRPAQIWLALYTSCVIYVDDTVDCFPADVDDFNLFNDRFVGRQQQGNAVLDTLSDLIRQTPDLFQPIPSKLIVTSTLNFFTANLLEHETASMQIVNAAEQYPTYQRTMTGITEGYTYMAFPREIPLTDYVQAIPEAILLVNDINDVLSFYKEELAGENNNRISLAAARNNESRLDTFGLVAEMAISHYKNIINILAESPEACKAFKQFTAGYAGFHVSSERYRLAELEL